MPARGGGTVAFEEGQGVKLRGGVAPPRKFEGGQRGFGSGKKITK